MSIAFVKDFSHGAGDIEATNCAQINCRFIEIAI